MPLIALPAVLFLLAFFFLPVGTVLLEGFRSPAAGGSLTLERILELAGDPYVRHLVTFTTRQAFLSSLLSVLIGAPLAYILANRTFRGRRVLSALTMVPFVMPSITVALGFLLMFGVNGWLNQVLDGLFGIRIGLLHTLWAIILAHAFYNAPVVARTTQAAWERIDPALEESARSLGAKPFAVWRDVTLPGILPGVLGGGVLAFVYSFLSFPIVLALGGARFSTLEVEIFTQVRVLLDYETGAALAAIQAGISLFFSYVFLRIEGRNAVSASSGRPRPLQPLFGKGLGSIVSVMFLALAGLLFFGPVASIFVDALKSPQSGRFSFDAFNQVLSAGHAAHVGEAPVNTIFNSLKFGVSAAVLAVLLGTSFTYALVRGLKRRRPLLETMTLAPLAVSSVAFAFGALLVFRQPPLDGIPIQWRIPLIHAVLAFPFVVRAFRPVVESVDLRWVEAARTLGAGRFRTMIDVEAPLLATGFLVAFAFAFGLSASEMSATMMLYRPGMATMPISVYRFLAAREFQAAGAMAVILIGVTAGTYLLAEALVAFMRRERKSPDGDGRSQKAE